MKQEILENYRRWLESATEDPDITLDLKRMAAREDLLEDAFYRDLEFGTAGLRGILGAGLNRMNLYTVARASQGLADYVAECFPPERRRIAIAYDSRIKSDAFARIAAGVFTANGIPVEIYKEMVPVPCLSFAVRELDCAAGIMITASHNPASYNGYKVYGPDGGQITEEAASRILAAIRQVDLFTGVRRIPFADGVERGLIHFIPDEIMDRFIETVSSLSAANGRVDRGISIVYTPLNGAGRKPVTRILRERGYTNVTVVKEQEEPDGRFPTCPYPNPENREALSLGLEYAKKNRADLLLATDPDCDRVGVAARNDWGDMELLTGNQVGILLLDWICAGKRKRGTMPPDPVLVKTIVTSDLADRVAESYGVRTVNVLTGFKFIGEQISLLERQGCPENYLLGFEESYGYLTGTHVRDKDGVNGAFLICEMAAQYAAAEKTLPGRLQELYRMFGYCLNTLHSYSFEGAAGMEKMRSIMGSLRLPMEDLGKKRILQVLDYSAGLDGLPPADVLKFVLEDNCSVVVRPSGTEPKIKAYISVSAPREADARGVEALLAADLSKKLA